MSQATSLLANCTCLRIPKSWFSAPVFHPDREGVVGIFAAVAAGFLLLMLLMLLMLLIR